MNQTLPTAREVCKVAKAHAEQVLPRPGLLRYTPLLPTVWPPAQHTSLRVYGYSVRPAPTGMVLYVVRTPRVAVTLGIDNSRIMLQNVDLRKDRELEDLQPRSMEGPSGQELASAGDALVLAAATGRLGTDESRHIWSIYRRWRTANIVIAAHLVQEHECFFRWLDEDDHVRGHAADLR